MKNGTYFHLRRPDKPLGNGEYAAVTAVSVFRIGLFLFLFLCWFWGRCAPVAGFPVISKTSAFALGTYITTASHCYLRFMVFGV
jgi:hypothetical protein